MNCLVTGAAGFLGSVLVEELCSQGHFVIGIDNFLSGTREKIELLKKFPNFKFIEQDICTLKPQVFDLEQGVDEMKEQRNCGLVSHRSQRVEPRKFDSQVGVDEMEGQKLVLNTSACSSVNQEQPCGRIDVVFNLACPASPPFYWKYPNETLATCSIGLFNVIDLALCHEAKLVHASTSEVYGEPLVHPQTELYFGNVDPTGPRSCYDEGKRFAEAAIVSAVKTRGLNATILRIFNSYGPAMRADDGRVVTNFLNAALTGKDIEIYGSGNQTRSFCYQSDTVSAFIAAWQCNQTGPFNIGSDQEITILELAQLIKKVTGSNSQIINKEASPQDPSRRRADTALALKIMGWHPKITSLQEGLKLMLKQYKNYEQGLKL